MAGFESRTETVSSLSMAASRSQTGDGSTHEKPDSHCSENPGDIVNDSGRIRLVHRPPNRWETWRRACSSSSVASGCSARSPCRLSILHVRLRSLTRRSFAFADIRAYPSNIIRSMVSVVSVFSSIGSPSYMIAQPVGKGLFANVSGRKTQHKCDDFRFGRFDPVSVEPQEYIHGLEGDPLVAVHARMVACESVAIGGGYPCQIGFGLVSPPVARVFQRGFEQALVTQSV